ncbi:hypothetical protein GS918_28050 [Rhodococcus hoagii]|nr:hypothetical protein [Prescottella equi]
MQQHRRPAAELRESAVDRVDDLLAAGLGGGPVAGLLVDAGGRLDDVPHGGCGGLADRARLFPLGQRGVGLLGDRGLVDAGQVDLDRLALVVARTECRTSGETGCASGDRTGDGGDRAADRCTGSGAGDCGRDDDHCGQPRDGGEWDRHIAADPEADVAADGAAISAPGTAPIPAPASAPPTVPAIWRPRLGPPARR